MITDEFSSENAIQLDINTRSVRPAAFACSLSLVFIIAILLTWLHLACASTSGSLAIRYLEIQSCRAWIYHLCWVMQNAGQWLKPTKNLCFTCSISVPNMTALTGSTPNKGVACMRHEETLPPPLVFLQTRKLIRIMIAMSPQSPRFHRSHSIRNTGLVTYWQNYA